jgi:hypothetical protein
MHAHDQSKATAMIMCMHSGWHTDSIAALHVSAAAAQQLHAHTEK